MIGQVIDGKYLILRLLGEGGMGAVYEAQNQKTGRNVALKVVSDAGAKRATAVARFQREAKVVGAVDTQHIVQIYDAGTDPATGCPYIAMELLAGEDVSQLLQRVRPLAPDLALRIAAQACLGLAKAHAAGVVHRDIKPANLYLARRDGGEFIVKILDFGIAKSLSDTSGAKMTATGAILGSPSYMSPEQVQGSDAIDARTDLWSLGAVLYEMLAGIVPYHRAQTIISLVTAICTEPPPPLQDFAKWVPPEVVGVVEGAMQRDLSRRFQNAVAMHEFIRRQLPGGSWAIHEGMFVPIDSRVLSTVAPRRTQSTASPVSDPIVRAETATAAPAPLADQGPPSKRRSPVVPIAATAIVMVLAASAVGVYRVTSRHTENPIANPAAAPSGSAAPSADIRTVRVNVTEGASAEIDGVPAPVTGGVVEISGKPGSTHPIRVFIGDRNVGTQIVITERGTALPDRVDLPMAATSAPPVSRPAVSRGVEPAKQPLPPKPAKPPSGLSTAF